MKKPVRGRPAKISRGMIAEIGAEIGLSDLTLLEVSRRLNVTLPTVYKHVKDQEMLLHLTADRLEERYALPRTEGMEWVDWWKLAAPMLREIYAQNSGLASVMMGRPISNTPPIERHWLPAQELAERSGFSPLNALWANLAVFEFVYSWAAHEDQEAAVKQGAAATELDAEFEEVTPRFRKVADVARSMPVDARFNFSLNALLTGLHHNREERLEATLGLAGD